LPRRILNFGAYIQPLLLAEIGIGFVKEFSKS